MNEDQNNPSAFPIGDTGLANPRFGMTLRDYFAGQAMAGFCANPAVFRENSDCGWKLVNTTEDVLAAYCISIADALLAERAKTGGGK